jgi:hypothetical protein
LSEYLKPIPTPDDETAPYWEAAREHILKFQRYTHCGHFAHPPVAFCLSCHNVTDPSFEFAPVKTTGKVLNWTVVKDAMVAGFENDEPWIWAMVALDEQPGLTLVATIEERGSEKLELDAPVNVVFKDVAPGVTLPVFQLTD